MATSNPNSVASPPEGSSRGRSPSEEGEERDNGPPPLPDEAPPLPEEDPPLPYDDPPSQEDDGWDAKMDANTGTWYFVNRFTGVSQWENPRVPQATGATNAGRVASPPGAEAPVMPKEPPKSYFGYNPKIHGDYDPNADYAKYHEEEMPAEETAPDANAESLIGTYDQVGTFNRFTGSFQSADKADHHNDENKSKRQMAAFFDVDAAANSHDGRSLKAERQQKKMSKATIKEFNDKRREKKEKKRRDFLLS